MQQLMGQYHELLDDILSKQKFPLSFLANEHSNVEEWQRTARAEVKKLLSYDPPEMPFDTQVHDEYEKDGLLYQHVSYAQPFGPRTQGILMRPAGAKGKLPGILGLHDHGGFKYYGKEKITSPKNAPSLFKLSQKHYYGGRAWASELALRGYVVFVPDLFMWGSRKIHLNDLPEWYVKRFDVVSRGGPYWMDEEVKPSFDSPEDSLPYLSAYNNMVGQMEDDIAKALFEAGTTWPGVMLADDMRALDFLANLPDVDTDNIGCGGLSGGGCRTVFLAAMDERVKCTVCVGFMSTSEDFAKYKVFHMWMMFVPGLTNLMDFSDLYSLHGKKPTMVLYDEDDELFTPKGQYDSNDRLTKIYEKMGVPEMYRGHFFPGPHKYDVEMQEIAFAFYDEWLK